MAYGTPDKQDTSAAHGEPLGQEEIPLDLAHTVEYRNHLIVLQGWELMLAGNRGYHQSWILRCTVQLNRLIVIHAFGGRGSPLVSRVAA